MKHELLGLIRRHKKSFSLSQLEDLIKRGSNSVFLDVVGDIPRNKLTRRDADSMQQLFIGVTRNPILNDTTITTGNHVIDRAEKALEELETLGLKSE